MPPRQSNVDLSTEERAALESFLSTDILNSRARTRARILLKADTGATDAEISAALDCRRLTANWPQKRYSTDGIAAIHRREHVHENDSTLDWEDEARLIALAASDPPDDRPHWTLDLLADEFEARGETAVESVSSETVRQTLSQSNSSLTEPAVE